MHKLLIDKKVAVFLADGHEEIEALTVVDLLRRAGIPVTTVSISDTHTITSSHQISIHADILLQDLDFDEYDMLVLPGGLPGTTHLKECAPLTAQLTAFAAQGKPLAAICAAPTVLAGLGLLEGKHATCYPAMEPDMKGAILTYESATTDGKFITGRGMGCAIDFGLAIVTYYLGEEAANALAESIVYRN